MRTALQAVPQTLLQNYHI